MIEIQAKLLRGPVYFVNETVQCLITLRNVPSKNQELSSAFSKESTNQEEYSNNGANDRLCWANVQLHCFCLIDDSLIKFSEIDDEDQKNYFLNGYGSIKNKRNSISLETYTSNDTSFHECLMRGERGTVIYASKPKILFCDLQLGPNQSETFVYTEVLPSQLNPSYSSPRLKYYYKLTIGTQRINSSIYLLKMPLRILTIENFPTSTNKNLDNFSNENDKNENNSVFNFDDDSKESGTSLDLALHRIEYLAGHRISHSFNITSSFGKVAKFFIFKTVYRLGEDILGFFDFSEGTVPCICYSVTLQSDESIAENNQTINVRSSVSHQTNHSRFQECSFNTKHSPMVLPIPFTVTPSFENNLISLKWSLSFRFVITTNKKTFPFVCDTNDGIQTIAPRQLASQVMTWDFPIKIVPTYPAHVAQGFQMASIGTLNI